MLAILLIAAAMLLGGALYAYRVTYYSVPKKPKKKSNKPGQSNPFLASQYDPYRTEMRRLRDQLQNRPCEFVTIKSRDGLTLSGRYYHVADGAPLAIGFHGYRSSYLVDFSFGSELTEQMGHNLLLVDQRAQGMSQGRTITFGLLERQDLICWVEYANARFGDHTPIFLYGVSMGGATVLMTPQEQLTPNVKGIVADCPYANALEIILHVAKSMPIPQWLIKPLVILGARIYGSFDLLETDAREELKKGHLPVLILHGTADTFVPDFMSDVASCNAKLIHRHLFPGADHGISALVDPQRYRTIVMEFVEKAM